ncbi:MAG: M48 family metallopeptidase [Bacteroidales bacterium]|nr:M48 family metallopeptidase [Candidatus Physcousia equi]
MNFDYSINHDILGRLYIRLDARARRFIFRATEDGIRVTAPACSTERHVCEAVERLLPELTALKKKANERYKKRCIDASFVINTPDFKMKVVEGDVGLPRAEMKEGDILITCPPNTNYEDEHLQSWILSVVEKSLSTIAKWLFPLRMSELSARTGLQFSTLKIKKSHGRWGSCSINKGINLSLYLVLVPRHLQEYVMLHELCHTIELNHSARFWQLLDSFTEGKAQLLRKELKNYNTCIPNFSQTS